MRLEGKVIIITGAARHLGQAYAVRLAKEGAKLTVADVIDCAETARLCEAEGAEVLPAEAWTLRARKRRWRWLGRPPNASGA